jgi:hypothetical protein
MKRFGLTTNRESQLEFQDQIAGALTEPQKGRYLHIEME